MSPVIYPVIMCGGYGSRLWPVSRLNLPKQFIKLFKQKSLFQKSICRLQLDPLFQEPIIVSNENQKYLLFEQIKELNIQNAQVILEPKALSTAPAATLAALSIYKESPEALMFLLPSDSEIKKENEFIKIAKKAAFIANQSQKYLLFGSKPQYPETGYGYIKSGKLIPNHYGIEVFNISKFTEKPSFSHAKSFIKKGYQWNSGMFIIPVSLYLKEIQEFSPDIYKACKAAFEKSKVSRLTTNEVISVDKKQFQKCPENSVDYAIMEKTANAAVINTDINWFDVGSWQTFYQLSKHNSNGNSVTGNVVTHNVYNSNIFTQDNTRLIALADVSGITVVQTNDATLVIPTHESQDVKKLVEYLKNNHLNDYLKDPVSYKKWGHTEEIRKEKYLRLCKVLIKGKKSVSFKANLKFKHFIVTQGVATFYIGRAKLTVKENDSLAIPQNIDYKITNQSGSSIELMRTETKDYQNSPSIFKNSRKVDI